MTGAAIDSGASTDLATVQVTSKGLFSTLYGTSSAYSVPDKTAKDVNTQAGIPGLLADDDQRLRLLACDRFGDSIGRYASLLFWDELTGTSPILNWLPTANVITNNYTPLRTMFNTAFSVGTSEGACLNSLPRFTPRAGARLLMTFRMAYLGVMGHQAFAGFFNNPASAGTVAHPDNGAYFNFSDGKVVPRLQFGSGLSNTSITGTDIGYLLTSDPRGHYQYDIMIEDDRVTYTVSDSAAARIISEQVLRVSGKQPRMFGVSKLSLGFWFKSSGQAPPSPGFMFTGPCSVMEFGFRRTLPFGHVMSKRHSNCCISPTQTQTANYANSAAPTPATLSNTAAGYTTLGGQFAFQVVTSAETDYALFGFTVPAPATGVGKPSLVVTGIHISMFLSNSVSSTQLRLRQFAVMANANLISLAAAGGQRVSLGSMALAAASPVGSEYADDIDVNFPEPLVTTPGRLFIVIVKCPAGAADATSLDRGEVDVRGYFE